MRKIISRYVSEHEHSLVHLIFLRDAVSRIISNGKNAEDVKIADDAFLFLVSELMSHCSREESELYPLLTDKMTPEIMLRLSQEHNVMTEKISEFGRILEVLKNGGYDTNSKEKIKADTNSIIDILYTHIKEENNLLNSVLTNIKSERKYNENKKIRI